MNGRPKTVTPLAREPDRTATPIAPTLQRRRHERSRGSFVSIKIGEALAGRGDGVTDLPPFDDADRQPPNRSALVLPPDLDRGPGADPGHRGPTDTKGRPSSGSLAASTRHTPSGPKPGPAFLGPADPAHRAGVTRPQCVHDHPTPGEVRRRQRTGLTWAPCRGRFMVLARRPRSRCRRGHSSGTSRTPRSAGSPRGRARFPWRRTGRCER